jgi:phosphocarrier protein HPr
VVTADEIMTQDTLVHGPDLELVVTNPSRLLSQAATRFVKTSLRFDSRILVEKDGEQVDGKSVLGLLTLGAGPGHRLTIRAQGSDASQALGALQSLFPPNEELI